VSWMKVELATECGSSGSSGSNSRTPLILYAKLARVRKLYHDYFVFVYNSIVLTIY
jgi:hypothetical protein